MSTLANLLASSLDRAEEFGVAAENPVLIQILSESGESRLLCASFEEPVDYTVPTNTLWLDCDPESTMYGQLKSRLSKDSGGAFEHTWKFINSLDDVYIELDVWATEDLPLVQTAIAAFNAHRNSTLADDPHGLKSYVDSKTGTLGSSFGAAFTNLNQRVIKNTTDINGLLALSLGDVIKAIHETDSTQNEEIAELKSKISELESAVEGRPGIPKHVHVQEEPSYSWVMEHYLDGSRFISEFFNAEGDPLFPASSEIVSNNTIAYVFAVPVAGHAVILKV